MKLVKNQLKTWNSQRSDVDMFSKLQNNFLEKFFRLNLIDYFEDIMVNVYEVHCHKKINNKSHKAMLNHLFIVNDNFIIQEFEQKLHKFYKSKSKSFQSGELQHIFKLRYCNRNPVPNYINKGQIILFQIKIKAQIEKLQILPKNLVDTLQKTCRRDLTQQQSVFKTLFNNYKGEYINIFIVYYGDINFQLIRKKNYQVQKVKIFQKQINIRIFTFFVSKQALLETFRTMNKITSLDHINDLVIQFYEVKREKNKQKKLKIQLVIKKRQESFFQKWKFYLCGGAFIAVAVAGVISKKII